MEEEQVFQAAAEAPFLCANNCGFFGSAATLNLCSKCYRHHRTKEEQSKFAKSAVETSLLVSPSSAVVVPLVSVAAEPPLVAAQPERCSVCRKRVGLTGFKCRCGSTCCGAHRYPEQHGCPFDYKAVGREAIARDNPVVKADKVVRL